MDRLKELPSQSVNTIVTSPPYFGLRDYCVDGQLGLESNPNDYVEIIVSVIREAKRILKDDGSLWLNVGDSYAANRTYQVPSTKGGAKHSLGQSVGGKGSKVPEGMKSKDLIGIPWMLAFALRADGWYLRQDIIWQKPNVMPESVKDRCTKSHEYIFLLTKKDKYYFDHLAVQEDAIKGARNRRSVWSISTTQFKGAHFAVFPEALAEPCILAGCPEDGTVLDPFSGAATTGVVALKNNRNYIGIELNPEYNLLAAGRLEQTMLTIQAKKGTD